MKMNNEVHVFTSLYNTFKSLLVVYVAISLAELLWFHTASTHISNIFLVFSLVYAVTMFISYFIQSKRGQDFALLVLLLSFVTTVLYSWLQPIAIYGHVNFFIIAGTLLAAILGSYWRLKVLQHK